MMRHFGMEVAFDGVLPRDLRFPVQAVNDYDACYKAPYGLPNIERQKGTLKRTAVRLRVGKDFATGIFRVARIRSRSIDMGTVARLGLRSPWSDMDRWLAGVSVRSRNRACHCRRRSEPAAEDRRRAAPRPAHLLRLVHPAVHQEVGRAFGRCRADPLPGSVPLGIVDQPGGHVARSRRVGAVAPAPIVGQAMRMEIGRSNSSMRLRAWTATSTSVARRWSVRERSPSPMTCLNLLMAASARARFV